MSNKKYEKTETDMIQKNIRSGIRNPKYSNSSSFLLFSSSGWNLVFILNLFCLGLTIEKDFSSSSGRSDAWWRLREMRWEMWIIKTSWKLSENTTEDQMKISESWKVVEIRKFQVRRVSRVEEIPRNDQKCKWNFCEAVQKLCALQSNFCRSLYLSRIYICTY